MSSSVCVCTVQWAIMLLLYHQPVQVSVLVAQEMLDHLGWLYRQHLWVCLKQLTSATIAGRPATWCCQHSVRSFVML